MRGRLSLLLWIWLNHSYCHHHQEDNCSGKTHLFGHVLFVAVVKQNTILLLGQQKCDAHRTVLIWVYC